MKSPAVLFWVFVLLVAAISYSAFSTLKHFTPAPPDASPVQTGQGKVTVNLSGAVKHFSLTDQEGKTFDTKELDGQVWCVSFFFSSCPQVCLQMNQQLAKLQEDKRYAEVKFVSITCDAENDPPAVLAQYARKFNADHGRWKFLTGKDEEIKKIGTGLGVSVKTRDHSDRVILIDRNGELRGAFRTGDAEHWEFAQRTLLKLVAEPVKPPVAVETKKAE